MKFNFNYIEHIEILIDKLIKKERPNWGYVEKYGFIEDLVKSFKYLEVSDKHITERAKQMLGDIK